MSLFRDDFERFAHDIIRAVTGGATAAQWQIDKVAGMLRAGPGVTVWPRDAAEAAQMARDRILRRPAPMKLPVLVRPVPPVGMPKMPPPLVLPKKP